MSYQKIANLILAVKEKTEEGAVPWVAADEGFQASFPKYAIKINQDYDFERDEVDLIFQIINESGDLVESVKDPDLSPFFENPFTIMSDIYGMARRHAMGVDDAIDEILHNLK